MATMIRAAAVFLTMSLAASAQSFWDGNAAIQRGDSGFESGAYAASNSFPADTEIVVENLETGKTAKAVVSQRISGQSDLLVLLSPKAAAELGLSQGRIASVRVTVKNPSPAAGERLPADLALSQDPDINPAAGMPSVQRVEKPAETTRAPAEEPLPGAALKPGAVEAPAGEQATVEGIQPSISEPRTLIAQAPAPEPRPAPGEETAAPEKPPAAAEQPAAQPKQIAQAPAAEKKPDWRDEVRRLASRSPQKQLFLPPREDERFAYRKPAETPGKEPPVGEKPVETPVVANPEATGAPSLPGKTEAGPFTLAELPAPPTGELPAPDVPTLHSLPGLFPPPQPKPDLALAEAGFPIEMNPEVTERLAASEQPEAGEALAMKPPEPEAAGEAPEETAALTAELSGTSPAPPEAAEVETLVALEPAAPKPPPEKIEPQKVAEKVVEKPQTGAVTLKPAGKSPPGAARPPGKKASYVIQLAAYASEKQARDTAAGLAKVYPVNVVLQEGKANPLFRLQVGPLNKAESGTLLLWFRYRGFPDAFIKSID